MWNPFAKIRAAVTHSTWTFSRATVRRFLRESSGNATVEYALFLTLVAACGIGAAEMLGVVTEATLQRLAFEQGQIATNLPPSTGTGTEIAPAAPEVPFELRTSPEPYQLAIGAIGVIIGWLVWYQLYYRRMLAKRAAVVDSFSEELESEDLSTRVFAKRQEILNILSGDWTGAARGEIEVGKLMSHNLCTIAPNAPRSAVEALLSGQSLRHVIVVDGEGAVLGMISDRDLQNRAGKRASHMMTPDPFTVAPHTPITPAVTLLVNRRISCLPVVEQGRLCGVLTTTDLIMALQCILQILVKQSLSGNNDGDEQTIEGERLSRPFDIPETTSTGS